MPLVKVLPSGVVVEVAPGATVFAAAREQGYRWPTVCEGQGSCHMCFMRVVEGADRLDEIGSWEAEGLAELGQVGKPGETLRLACQAGVRGDVTVVKRGVKLLGAARSPAETDSDRGKG